MVTEKHKTFIRNTA